MASRNIVLLSDGTGNSAGKITKTNVWRIFEAIDLGSGDQLAFFDDGVGTGGSRILRMLGGGLGYGLARNVRQLYEELCRHYSGPEDRIMLFGFSRGAFTVRVLSGLIEHCGIIDRTKGNTVKVWRWSKFRSEPVSVATDEGLKKAIRVAYRSLKKRGDKAFFSTVFRRVRDTFFVETPKTEDFRSRFSVSPRPRIAFLGVFDTVSAYGLPIDEMAIVIHKYFFRLRFPNMILSRKVDNAVQALALDEARQTFHPVLWTERTYDPGGGEGDPDPRPVQAWFAGVHSDIGGGYSNERLSLVPAIWMLEQARRLAALRIRRSALDDLRQRASHLGEIHDSRRGLGAFYRYKPRMLAQLGREDLDGNGYVEVRVDRFKIHETALQRIRDTNADYAPLGIPEDYDVVRRTVAADGTVGQEIVAASQAGFETDEQRRRRADLLRGVEDAVFWRRTAYFVMTGIALVLALVPFLWLTNPAEISEGVLASIVSPIASLAGYMPLPGADRIGRFWTQNPGWFLVLAALYLATWLVSGSLTRKARGTAQAAWAHVAGRTAPAVSPRRQWLATWRSGTGKLHRIWTKKAFPLLLVLLLFVVAPAIFAWRLYLFTPLEGGSICVHQHKEFKPEIPSGDGTVLFRTSDPCLATGLELEQGRLYKLELTIGEAWRDGGPSGFPAGPPGLSWSEMSWRAWLAMAAGSLLRRFWSEDWYGLMGSIGRSREYVFRIDAEPVAPGSNVHVYRFHAWRSGRLYLFVNDGINPFRSRRLCAGPMDEEDPWRCYYDNNVGTATVRVVEESEL